MGKNFIFRFLFLFLSINNSSMPFDDSNIRKLVRYQLEKKIHFSRYKPLSIECKQLILSLLEPDIKLRATIFQIKNNHWIKGHIYNNHSSTNISLQTIERSIPKIFHPTENNIQKTTIIENYQLDTFYRKHSFQQINNESLITSLAKY